MKLFKLLVLSISVFSLLACQGGEDRTNIELIQNMMDGPQIRTQEGSPDGKPFVREVPKNTISRNYKPYPYEKSDLASAEKLKSPKAELDVKELLIFKKVGKQKYDIYCGICHGVNGRGKGSIASKMLKAPPSLVTDVYKSYSDGRLYSVVTNGWGLMGGYASQVPVERERWAIVNYVRELQAKAK